MRYPNDFTDDLRRKPICGVLSTAMIAKVSFAKATDVIKNNLMPHQKRHGGKTYHEQRLNALRELGVPFREVPVRKQTLQNWVKCATLTGKLYMVTTSKHVVTVRDELVADQCEINYIDDHVARRCFVRHVVEIG